MAHTHFWIWGLVCFVVWWIVASGIVMVAYNNIFAALFGWKKAGFWQGFWFVTALVVLCIPHQMGQMRMARMMRHGHMMMWERGHMDGDMDEDEGAAPAAAPAAPATAPAPAAKP